MGNSRYARTLTVNLTVKGYLAVYNQRSVDLGNFTEIVAPGAFTNSLKVSPDVRLLANHDWTKPLARTASGTLTLRDDSHGLGFTGTLPDTTYARDLSESMSRGDVTGCSFGFNCDDDSWANTDDGVVRTLRAVSLIEGSIVTVPAYPQTSVCLRSAPADIRALLGDLRTSSWVTTTTVMTTMIARAVSTMKTANVPARMKTRIREAISTQITTRVRWQSSWPVDGSSTRVFAILGSG